ncbi:MAG: Stp1/IreP family PP2C-type Ser/Thr phosphatase [Acidobacteriota bacterium]
MKHGVEFQARTDQGLFRPNNEDAFLTRPDIGLCAVCDGLGGHAAGEVASSLAVETLRDFQPSAGADAGRELAALVAEANRRIYEDQREHPERRGMGTTLTALWIPEPAVGPAWVAHVGDSRLYRLRGERLDQLTDDHSPVFRLYKEGVLSKADLRHHPHKNVVERSLGLGPEVACDIFSTTAWVGDLFLLCSDGLSDCVDDAEILRICLDTGWDELGDKLVGRALECGGYDNITVVLAKIY